MSKRELTDDLDKVNVDLPLSRAAPLMADLPVIDPIAEAFDELRAALVASDQAQVDRLATLERHIAEECASKRAAADAAMRLNAARADLDHALRGKR